MTGEDAPTIEWLQRLPKVELHVHLAGAIPLDTLWDLVRKYGPDPDIPDPAALRAMYRYRDFAHFIEVWGRQSDLLRSYEDFTFIAEAVARRLADQRIGYVEMLYSPSTYARRGMDIGELTRAVRLGLDRVDGVRVALIADLVRDVGPEAEAAALDALAEVRDLGVVGVGLGGSEHRYPPQPFAALFERARRLGFHTCVHAGEAAGPESVWSAVRDLGAERIGHGTRIAADEALMAHLADRRIAVDACCTSNVRTGVIGSVADHPIARFVDRGIAVTVNTDDPTMFQTDLASEFAALATAQGLRRKDIRHTLLTGIGVSWLSTEEKIELAATFRADPAWGQ